MFHQRIFNLPLLRLGGQAEKIDSPDANCATGCCTNSPSAKPPAHPLFSAWLNPNIPDRRKPRIFRETPRVPPGRISFGGVPLDSRCSSARHPCRRFRWCRRVAPQPPATGWEASGFQTRFASSAFSIPEGCVGEGVGQSAAGLASLRDAAFGGTMIRWCRRVAPQPPATG